MAGATDWFDVAIQQDQSSSGNTKQNSNVTYCLEDFFWLAPVDDSIIFVNGAWTNKLSYELSVANPEQLAKLRYDLGLRLLPQNICVDQSDRKTYWNDPRAKSCLVVQDAVRVNWYNSPSGGTITKMAQDRQIQKFFPRGNGAEAALATLILEAAQSGKACAGGKWKAKQFLDYSVLRLKQLRSEAAKLELPEP